MSTIPIKLNDSVLKKIDYLIKIGRYKNRSQAIKAFIEEKLALETIRLDFESSENSSLKKKIIQDLVSSPDFFFEIKNKKSAAEIVAEERERY